MESKATSIFLTVKNVTSAIVSIQNGYSICAVQNTKIEIHYFYSFENGTRRCIASIKTHFRLFNKLKKFKHDSFSYITLVQHYQLPSPYFLLRAPITNDTDIIYTRHTR